MWSQVFPEKWSTTPLHIFYLKFQIWLVLWSFDCRHEITLLSGRMSSTLYYAAATQCWKCTATILISGIHYKHLLCIDYVLFWVTPLAGNQELKSFLVKPREAGEMADRWRVMDSLLQYKVVVPSTHIDCLQSAITTLLGILAVMCTYTWYLR